MAKKRSASEESDIEDATTQTASSAKRKRANTNGDVHEPKDRYSSEVPIDAGDDEASVKEDPDEDSKFEEKFEAKMWMAIENKSKTAGVRRNVVDSERLWPHAYSCSASCSTWNYPTY
jgi:hypothetical protein